MNAFDKGDDVIISAVFKDDNGVQVDPSTVTCRIKDPSGNTNVLTGGGLTHTGTGQYQAVVNADEEGTWQYRFESSGTAQAAEEGEFWIRGSFF
jgi:hypothetical protein